MLDTYSGKYCIESFDPRIVAWFKKNRPHVIRGQLSSGFMRDSDSPKNLKYFVLHHMLLNFLSRPDFIAYDEKFCDSLAFRITTKLFRAAPVAWTVSSQQRLEELHREYTYFIFEGFSA